VNSHAHQHAHHHNHAQNNNDDDTVFHVHDDSDQSSGVTQTRGNVTLTCVVLGAVALVCWIFRRKLGRAVNRPSHYDVIRSTPSRSAVISEKLEKLALDKDALDLNAHHPAATTNGKVSDGMVSTGGVNGNSKAYGSTMNGSSGGGDMAAAADGSVRINLTV